MSRRADRKVVVLVALLALFAAASLLWPRLSAGQLQAGRRTADVTSFGRDVSVTGTVTGGVQAVGASATIDGRVQGDVVVFGGNVRLLTDAFIEGDVVCVGGRVERAQGAHVAGEVFAPGSLGAGFRIAGARTAQSFDQRPLSLISIALKLSLLLVWLVAAVVVTLISGRDVRSSSVELRGTAFHTFVLGLVAFTSFVLTAIVFSYLIPYLVGIPLIAALAIFALLAKVYGLIAVFHAVGSTVAGPRSRQTLTRRRFMRGDLAMVMIGLLILGALRMIPVAGDMIWMAASIFGIGSALATKFGRREPWFLAVQTAPRSSF